MTIFAWVMLVLSGISFLLALPTVFNSKFLSGLITLVVHAATVFYFVSYLFIDIGSIFNILTWVLLGLSALGALTVLFTQKEAKIITFLFFIPQIVFYVLQLI